MPRVLSPETAKAIHQAPTNEAERAAEVAYCAELMRRFREYELDPKNFLRRMRQKPIPTAIVRRL